MKHLLTTFILFINFSVIAQNNKLLDRKFWSNTTTVEAVKKAIEEGHDPTQLNPNSFDPMVYAILQDAPLKTLQYLQSIKGNDVNKLTHDGRTYIFWAAYKGNDRFMQYLLDNGAKTDILDDHGLTILNFAANAGQTNTKVYDLCIKYGANLKKDVNHNGANALLLAAPSDKDFKLIDYFTTKGLDLNSTDNNGNGIYNYVARTGNLELLQKLSTKGVKGNDQAFLFASQGTRNVSNGLEVFTFLEAQGLNPNTSSNEGVTPLHYIAARSQNIDVLNYLIRKGNNVNAKDKDGSTPFLNAVSRNSIKVIETLIPQVKDINDYNKKGQTALMLATQSNTLEVIKLLISKEAKVDVVDANGNNLNYYLIEAFSPRQPKDFAIKLEFLKSKGLDISKKQKDGNTLLHLAVNKQNLDLIKQVVNLKVADVNAINNDGNTALHLAAMSSKDEKIIKYLLSIGADKTIKTEFGESAYDLASENELLEQNNVSLEILK